MTLKSTYKESIKTLPNGDIKFKGTILQLALYVNKIDAYKRIKKMTAERRYFFFGEYILTATIDPNHENPTCISE